MKYEGVIYRPPSEAYSLILQVAVGCSHNKCAFCGSFKDKSSGSRPSRRSKRTSKRPRRTRGTSSASSLPTAMRSSSRKRGSFPLSSLVKTSFPGLERIGIYGNTKSILKKSVDDLKALKELGVGIIYLGVESGDQVTLDRVCKGTLSIRRPKRRSA